MQPKLPLWRFKLWQLRLFFFSLKHVSVLKVLNVAGLIWELIFWTVTEPSIVIITSVNTWHNNTWSLSNGTALCLCAYWLGMYFNACPSIGTGWLDYELYRHSLFYLRTIKTLGFTHCQGDNQTLLGLSLYVATLNRTDLVTESKVSFRTKERLTTPL